jgi:Zn-dependent membrane protease YugP
MFYFDPLFIIISIPALLLGLWAQLRVKSAFSKYSKVRSWSGMSGAEVARRILDSSGLYNVEVQPVSGFLSDYYDPGKKILRLDSETYRSPSIAAAGIAAHEAGHALQDQQGYLALQVRSAMVPTVQFGSWLGPIIFLVGFFMQGTVGTSIAWLGVGLFSATALFAIVTLPVELNASHRAKELLVNKGIVSVQDKQGVDTVLDAAALTYVAAAIQAISTLLYYVLLLTGISRRR